ncbi:MAG: MoaD/ThiS family protein [Nocardioides sp.]
MTDEPVTALRGETPARPVDVPADSSPALGGTVAVRYWAGAKAAAGVAGEDVEVAAPISLAELVDRVCADRSGQFARVLSVCAVLVGDRPVSSEAPASVMISPGASVEFLPPFAGG